jgi:DNA-binding NarL/FixJ family response regulator
MDTGDKRMTTVTILLVDDNVVFRETLKTVLINNSPNIHVVETENAAQTLEHIQCATPTLIFMDIDLAGDNGLRLTEKIKSLNPEIPVFVVTNHDSIEYREAAVQAGADGFFSKTSSPLHDLIEAVLSFRSVEDR